MLELNTFDYTRQVLALSADELEIVVRKWANTQKQKYDLVTRQSGSGDRGCDVVGFYSPNKFEGDWDNYQCKQYSKTVPTDKGMHEIGKILYYAYLKEFKAPKSYYFVAPKGINRNLRNWILNPSKLKAVLLNDWDKYCKSTIIDGTEILLSKELRDFISNYDFSSIGIITIDDIIDDFKFKAILVEMFGGELPSAPQGEVPDQIDASELIYVNKILDVYSDYDQQTYSTPNEVYGHDIFEDDFMEQRERFYSAEAFKAFYRDNTVEGVLDAFEREVFKGIKPSLFLPYNNSFERMCSVLSDAGKIQPSGKLALHGKVDVKQGYCHHFANQERLNWRRK